MRCFLYILVAIWLGISVQAAAASDVLLGVVVALDQNKGRMTLRVIDGAGRGGETLSVTIAPEKIPNGLSSGDTVRVWGKFASGVMGAFKADSVQRRGAGGNGADPTGVRSRLGQGGGYGGGQGGGQGAGGKGPGRK